MLQKRVPNLLFNIDSMHIEQVTEFKFLGPITDSSQNRKAHLNRTEPLFIRMNQPKLSDLYTYQLIKLYYRLYRNKLPRYFANFLPKIGIHNQLGI